MSAPPIAAARRRAAGRHACLGAVLSLALAHAAVAGAAEFLRDVDDLPLMPGLYEELDRGVVFDKPGGRVVEALASGRVARAAFDAFYAETLPALGWQRLAPARWQRDGEQLRLEIVADGPPLVVRFYLAPQ